nr:MAG TPA: hypothetical protein [Caudoviricetes sp.]
MDNIYDAMREAIEARKERSAWGRGVQAYAVDLVETLRGRAKYEGRAPAPEEVREWLLNGARSWSEYSWGGSALIYDGDIAANLCTPSELKRTRNGERRPNSREEWLDVQARALHQAANRVIKAHRAALIASNLVINPYGILIDFDAAGALMDDDIREEVHAELAPCTPQAFFDRYCQLHAERYGEPWELAKPNPCY